MGRKHTDHQITTGKPPPPAASAAQTLAPLRPVPKPTVNSVWTQTPAPPPNTYDEAATQHSPTPPKSPNLPRTSAFASSASASSSPYEDISEYEREVEFLPSKQKGAYHRTPPTPPSGKGKQRASQPPHDPLPTPPQSQVPQFAVVLHAVPTKYKLGEVHRWLEEDNNHLCIAGSRWLLADKRRLGKTHSSVVLYLQDPTIATRLRLGRRSLRTTTYDWNR